MGIFQLELRWTYQLASVTTVASLGKNHSSYDLGRWLLNGNGK